MKCCRIEIGSVWPNERMNFGINANLIENGQLFKSTKHFASENRLKIDYLLDSVIEPNSQYIGGYNFNRSYAIDGVDSHVIKSSSKRFNRQGQLAGL